MRVACEVELPFKMWMELQNATDRYANSPFGLCTNGIRPYGRPVGDFYELSVAGSWGTMGALTPKSDHRPSREGRSV